MRIVILSGVPGCGKSRWASKSGADIVVSADDYLPTNPQPADFGEAHRKCFKVFITAIQHQDSTIPDAEYVVVDNTNLTAAEIAPYYLASETYGATVEVRRIHRDLKTCLDQQKHNVPFDIWIGMAARFKVRDVMPWWAVYEEK